MAIDLETSCQMANEPPHAKELESHPINTPLEEAQNLQKLFPIISPPTNPQQSSKSHTPTPALDLINSVDTQDANHCFSQPEKTKASPNSSTNKINNGKSTTTQPSTSQSPDHLCPTTPSSKLPTCLMDGDGPHGTCMLVQHPSEWPRHCDHTTRHSISSPTSDRGHEVGYEKLLEPSLAKQYTSTPSPVSEPTVGPCNEEPMEPPTPFQSNIPTECPNGYAFLHAGEHLPTKPHSLTMGAATATPSNSNSTTTPIPTIQKISKNQWRKQWEKRKSH
ncbi:PREDICTED: proline-rich receptor-like protein kinase PERK12 [Nicotiana attenuata]|uniref:proline-rich receptor-like protein kinase PERK12 n=1 Tax=Nicotiana attenuata TaxID=49451 RepID=UPI000905B5AA|nr:PREDICTED: proline-rich receptor-like protein kinase PERK12 [Nicotiana attenuata]